MKPSSPQVAILMLTHNALRHVWRALRSLRHTRDVDYEVVVVDNASGPSLRLMLRALTAIGWINRLRMLDHNALFAAGNNVAARLACPTCSHVLLLNSDVEIRNPAWLQHLLAGHRRGISAYGVVSSGPLPRVDGYCLLIDRDLYLPDGLDECFPWWWSVTRLQARVLVAGHAVRGVARHEAYLHHVGGASGGAHLATRTESVSAESVRAWFAGHRVDIQPTLT